MSDADVLRAEVLADEFCRASHQYGWPQPSSAARQYLIGMFLAARADGLEQAAKVVCPGCRSNWPLDGDWHTTPNKQRSYCVAGPVRALRAQLDAESGRYECVVCGEPWPDGAETCPRVSTCDGYRWRSPKAARPDAEEKA